MTSPSFVHTSPPSPNGDGGAWIGVEIGELRWQTGAAARLDLTAHLDRKVGALLSYLHSPDGSLAVELRFLRDPARTGLRAAVLCQVRGPSSAVTGRAAQTLERLLENGSEVTTMCALGEPEMRSWREAPGTQLSWTLVAQRRLLVPEARGYEAWAAFQPLLAKADGWQELLEALAEAPAPTALGIRLRGVTPTPDQLDYFDRLLENLEQFTTDWYPASDAAMGTSHRQPASPFAVDARPVLAQLGSHRSERQYRCSVVACGTGGAGSLRSALERLCDAVPDHPASAVFRQRPLDVLGLDSSALPTVTACQRDLRSLRVDTPARDRAPRAMAGLVDVVSQTEAVSLFHLPRADAPPTPGFRLHGLVDPYLRVPSRPFVFISYQHDDADLAYHLVTLLRGWSTPVWWDHMLVGGDEWRSELASALRDQHCRAVVVALTERTAMSPWVEREIFTAKSHGRPVIQVRLRPAPPMDLEVQVVPLDGWYGRPDDCHLELLRNALAKALPVEAEARSSR